MQRSYRVRNRSVEVDELPDVRAVRAPRQELPQPRERALIDQNAQKAFELSGWQVVPSSSVARRGLGGSQAVVAKIFRRPGGQLVLGANRASVKFRPSVTRRQIDALLASLGCRVVAPIPVAPNMFTIEAEFPEDVFDVLPALNADPRCEFAEPDFVEAMTGR